MAMGGGCACGAVRYELLKPPMFVQCCHCHDCQRQTGAAFVINAITEIENVRMMGEMPVGVPVPTESGLPHTIFRCARCQTAIFSDYGGNKPNIRFLRVGTLDDPSAIRPMAHVFARSKLPWVVIPEDQPAFDIYYEMETFWPAASLRRFEAAMAAPQQQFAS
jgi:hypothetical protein